MQWKEVPNAIFLMFINITKMRAAEEQKVRMKVQKLMFQNASHELKTPLNSIISNAILSETKLKELAGALKAPEPEVRGALEKLKKYVANIRVASTLNMYYVGDIMDLYKLENQEVEIARSFVDLVKVAAHLRDLFQYQCDQKKLKFSLALDPLLLSHALFLDEPKVKQILVNLITNSIKFTQKGMVELNINFDNDSR